jgi:hypothetical protein
MSQIFFSAITPHARTMTGADPLRSPRRSLLTLFLGFVGFFAGDLGAVGL